MLYIQGALELDGSEMSGQLVVDVSLLLFLSGHMTGGQDGLLGAAERILPDLAIQGSGRSMILDQLVEFNDLLINTYIRARSVHVGVHRARI